MYTKLSFLFLIILSGCSPNTPSPSESFFSGSEEIPLLGDSIQVEQTQLFLTGLMTDTSRANIALDEILDGGPGKDGIPALYAPKFLQIRELTDASYLKDDLLGIFVASGGRERFYPYSILVWHEIVNDTIGGVPIAVTYCPLCGTAIVYNRRTMSGVLDFGVSGRLWQSNLLMYDRQSESLWSQAEGRAVVGAKNGQRLEYYPSSLITWGEFRKISPSGEVLSNDTGYPRDYTRMPYQGYDTADGLYFPVNHSDTTLPEKELLYVVKDGDIFIGFQISELKKSSTLGKDGYTAEYNDGTILVTKDGRSFSGFYQMWFSFYTHHKDNYLLITTNEK